MKYLKLPRSPEEEPHHHIQFSATSMNLVWAGDITLLHRKDSVFFDRVKFFFRLLKLKQEEWDNIFISKDRFMKVI